ncbi:PRA1 family protein-domain-containing protein [Boeremia exigua]|uniref:PRA1 family protein-domain-containing protein n=1 Tax=Boeremia exigua TaxID=749465 RepID=UPI001E8CD31F|nr:PRA1 family protein-domain-containing protein [Boeremia exigua]KAH6612424.1 PRA1 family protein-domain-containing protein [Boeremia exigua]
MTSPAEREEQHQTLITPDAPQLQPQPQPAPAQTSNPFAATMSRFNIPISALTSRMDLQGRFDGLRSTSVSSRFANLRPISEFLDVKRISKPANFSEAQGRINFNLGYFSSNYAAVFAMLSIYSLLTHLLLLFVIIFVIGGMYGIGKLEGNDLQIASWRATTSQLYTTLAIIAIPLGLWSSPFSAVLWLIGASGVTIIGHAAFLDKPIEYQDVTETTGVNVEQGYQQASDSKPLLNKDDLYFNDMDIRAWERRTAALGGAPPRNDRYQEDEGYDGDRMSAAEYEEVLFQRVLDKIRLARAADIPDVQLTPEELDAYQSKLHGTRSPAVRTPRSPLSPPLTDAMSVSSASKKSSSSRAKKESRSLFAPKPKKENPSRKPAPSNMSSAPPPGFMVPGPDGQPIYTPINAYQGDLTRDPTPPAPPVPRHVPASERPVPTRRALIDMPGAFPGALPTSPHLYHRPQDLPPTAGLGISRAPPSSSLSLSPTVEPYVYHTPKPTYTRVSSAESSFTAVPRRVPVPQPSLPDVGLGARAERASGAVDGVRAERAQDGVVLGDASAGKAADADAQTLGGKSVKDGKREERRRKSKGKRAL